LLIISFNDAIANLGPAIFDNNDSDHPKSSRLEMNVLHWPLMVAFKPPDGWAYFRINYLDGGVIS